MRRDLERVSGVLAVLSLLTLSGCMSGTVSVQNDDGAAQAAKPASQGAGQESGSSAGDSAGGAGISASAARTLFFQAIGSPDGAADSADPAGQVTGLGFLSAGAQATTPFQFAEPAIVYWKPVLIGGQEEVAWVEQSPSQSNGGAMELEVLDPSSMRSQEMMGVPQASSYALFGDATATEETPLVAGIDLSGNLFIKRPMGLVQNAASGFSSGAQVSWVGGDQMLAVADPVSHTISGFSVSGLVTSAPKVVRSISFQGDVFSASPSGKTYLVFLAGANGAPGQLSMISAGSGKPQPVGVSVTTMIGARWSGENEVAFVDSSSAGTQVDVLSLSSGKIAVQYPVSGLSPSAVCPSWVGGGLFFAGEDAQGVPVIWAADGASPATREFAAPAELDGESGQGYDCPKGVWE